MRVEYVCTHTRYNRWTCHTRYTLRLAILASFNYYPGRSRLVRASGSFWDARRGDSDDHLSLYDRDRGTQSQLAVISVISVISVITLLLPVSIRYTHYTLNSLSYILYAFILTVRYTYCTLLYSLYAILTVCFYTHGTLSHCTLLYSRYAISLYAILTIQVSGDVNLLLPVMLVILVARLVGDHFNESIYEIHLRLAQARPHLLA